MDDFDLFSNSAASSADNSRASVSTRSSAVGSVSGTQRPGGLRKRRWMFTINTDASLWDKYVKEKISLPDWRVRSMHWQHELAPETGNHHIQGYLELKYSLNLKQLKEQVFVRTGFNADGRENVGFNHVHLEDAKGTQEQCIAYCSKEETRVPGTTPNHIGEPAGKNGESDSKPVEAIIASKIKEGVSFDSLLEDFPEYMLRNGRKVKEYYDQIETSKHRHVYKPKYVEVRYGPTGSGKSFSAWNQYKEKCFILTSSMASSGRTIWFDGYAGESVLILEEMPFAMSADQFLSLTDPYPFHVQVKGSSVMAKWKHVICTSNYHPDKWWSEICTGIAYQPETLRAARARIHTITEMSGTDYRQTTSPPRPVTPVFADNDNETTQHRHSDQSSGTRSNRPPQNDHAHRGQESTREAPHLAFVQTTTDPTSSRSSTLSTMSAVLRRMQDLMNQEEDNE